MKTNLYGLSKFWPLFLFYVELSIHFWQLYLHMYVAQCAKSKNFTVTCPENNLGTLSFSAAKEIYFTEITDKNCDTKFLKIPHCICTILS